METRHPREGSFGSEFPAICNHCGAVAAGSVKTPITPDWAKNPDKPPIFEKPPGRLDRSPKRGRVWGNPDVW